MEWLLQEEIIGTALPLAGRFFAYTVRDVFPMHN
jgi:hypothetical protein